jgi:hypothetical protein
MIGEVQIVFILNIFLVDKKLVDDMMHKKEQTKSSGDISGAVTKCLGNVTLSEQYPAL